MIPEIADIDQQKRDSGENQPTPIRDTVQHTIPLRRQLEPLLWFQPRTQMA